MRSLLSLLLLATVAHSAILQPYSLTDDLIQLMSFREQPSNAAFTVCQDIQFQYCQAQFNQFFGMDDMVSWRNGSYIFQTVQNYLMMNVTELVKVCNQRTQFYQCLGASYYSCMNLYTLLNKPQPDFSDTFDYVRTFRGLEGMCVGGFSEVVAQWDCLGTFPTTNAYQNCINNFNQTVAANNFCPAVQQTGVCLNDAYNAACGGPAAGYFGCEMFRITFDNSCWGLRCMVDTY
uniref:DUF19 domain-containing protein n=1 Tax=Caenorhabditis tropicalis TaxID=1561998 RepID=A0A1I7U646_9PELO